jgi:hypothetical protein
MQAPHQPVFGFTRQEHRAHHCSSPNDVHGSPVAAALSDVCFQTEIAGPKQLVGRCALPSHLSLSDTGQVVNGIAVEAI